MTTYAVGASGARGPPTAVWGMWILIASEATLFGAFIGDVLLPPLPARAPGRRPGRPRPTLLAPIVLAAVLALTAIPMQLASRRRPRGRRRPRLAARPRAR